MSQENEKLELDLNSHFIWDNTDENEDKDIEDEEEIKVDIENEEDYIDDDTSEEDNEEDDEVEEEIFKNGYETFKDSIFKFLPEDYKFKATEKGFEDALKETEKNLFENIHNQYLSNFENNPKAKEYLNFITETGGKGDVDKWIKINLSDNYTEEDLENEEIQKKVIRAYYEKTGIEKDYIEEKIIDLEDFGKLDKEAKIALKYLNSSKDSENKNLIDGVKNQEIKEKEQYNINYEILNNIVKETKIPQKRQEYIIKEILDPVELSNGKKMTMLDYRLAVIKNNPEHIIELANVLMNYDPKKGLNIEKIINTKENTKQTKNLRQKLESIEGNSFISKSKSQAFNKGRKNNIDLSGASFIIG